MIDVLFPKISVTVPEVEKYNLHLIDVEESRSRAKHHRKSFVTAGEDPFG